MTSDEPKTEAEFLERESLLAKESLVQIRGEVFASLARTADAGAWTQRYPWPALGAAAAAGVTTGWGMGKMLWKSRKPQASTAAEATAASPQAAAPSRGANAAASLVGGLGTLASAVASAVAGAATEAMKDVIKDKVHETFNPTPADDVSNATTSPAGTSPKGT